MYKIQQGNEEINSNGGISLIGALLSNVKSFMKFDKMTFGKVKKVNTSSGSDFPRKVNDISQKKAKKFYLVLKKAKQRLRKIIGFVCVHALSSSKRGISVGGAVRFLCVN